MYVPKAGGCITGGYCPGFPPGGSWYGGGAMKPAPKISRMRMDYVLSNVSINGRFHNQNDPKNRIH
jgi:hypothetical protein